MMKNRMIVVLAATVAVAWGATVRGAQISKPNMVFLLADDMNRDTWGAYGGKDCKTPNIDQLASEGMRFDRAYCSVAMCAPFRQELYSGRTPWRTGTLPNHSKSKPGTRSIPHYLQPLGYRVALIGKAHIGPEEAYPFERLDAPRVKGGGKNASLVQGAMAFIDSCKEEGKPFCLFICSSDSHAPFTSGDRSIYNADDFTIPPYWLDTPALREVLVKYYAEITNFDALVGQTRKQLEERGVWSNTIFMVCGEQGAQLPFAKWTCYDNGLRTGLVAHWPRVIKPGSVVDELISTADITPTFVDAAGGILKPGDCDGKSFLKTLKGEPQVLHEHVYGAFTNCRIIGNRERVYPIRVIRDKEYSLIYNPNFKELTSNTTLTGVLARSGYADARRADTENQATANSFYDIRDTSPKAKVLVHKLNHRPEYELYDLRKDPYELKNEIDNPEYKQAADTLKELLCQRLVELGDSDPIATERALIDEKKKEAAIKKTQKIRTKKAGTKPFSYRLTAKPITATSAATPTYGKQTPNILIILADDYGWGDVSCNNPEIELKSPAVDRLAREGIRFTNAHTPSAVCSPTRYGLLTGRYPWRSYMKQRVLSGYCPALITEDRVNIASYLKSEGYRTGGFGKWHLGLDWAAKKDASMDWRDHWQTRSGKMIVEAGRAIDHTAPIQNSPVDIGFDTYFGTPSNCTRLPFFIQDNHVVGPVSPNKHGMLQDPGCVRNQVDDRYVAKAIRFLEDHEKNHQDQPFFIYLPLNAIHSATGGGPSRFQGKSRLGAREDKIFWVNHSVEKMLAALDRMNLVDDTLVIFTSDNGPTRNPDAIAKGHHAAGPYRGFKTCVWDGGTRVPFLARWPGHIPAGVTTDQLFGLTDVLSTVAALCGSPLPDGAGPDSVNQLPVLFQDKEQIVERPPLVTVSNWGIPSVRRGKWKAIFGSKWSGGIRSKHYGPENIPADVPDDAPSLGQLYDISTDPYETHDLWESHPEVVASLRRELERIQQLDKSDDIRW